MTGNEPIVTGSGESIRDAHGRPSYVTSAGDSPSTGKYLLMAYLPVELAKEGAKFGVIYMNEQFPVTVEVVGSRPFFDPENDRMKS